MPIIDEATRRLAGFIATLAPQQIPAELSATYELIFIDAVACALGSRSVIGLAGALAAASDALGDDVADDDLVGGTTLSSAFVRAARVAAAGTQPLGAGDAPLGVIALAGALTAPPGRTALDGPGLLAAAIVGAEIHVRLGVAAAARAATPPRWNNAQLLSHFGLAAATARAMALDEESACSALGLAVCSANGARPEISAGAGWLPAAFAAQSGSWAAVQAASGIDARFAALGGEFGLFPLWFGLDRIEEALDGLGTEFICDAVAFQGPSTQFDTAPSGVSQAGETVAVVYAKFHEAAANAGLTSAFAGEGFELLCGLSTLPDAGLLSSWLTTALGDHRPVERP